MTWQPELEELERRMALARRMGGQENVERQHTSGKLTIRERLERLVDPGSFAETGGLAGKVEYDADGNITDFRPANYVMGMARIGGRRVVVGGD
ncbi:MAG: carboxyl transferase domain-containing protein, partial [Dehalococcoidia bacterium]